MLRRAQDALEQKQIEDLANQCTNLPRDYVPTVLGYLLCDCEKISFEEVAKKESEVASVA